MSTNSVCFRGEIRKISVLFGRKKGSYGEISKLAMNPKTNP